MSEISDPFLTPRTRPLTTTSSSDALNADPFIPPNPQFSRDSAYAPQPSLTSTPRDSAIGDIPGSQSPYYSYDATPAANSNNHVPLLDQAGGHGTPRFDAGKEYDPYANRSGDSYGQSGKKSLFRRPLFWLVLAALVVVVVLAVILPVYFVVIKPNNRSTSASGASSNNGGGGNSNNTPGGNSNGGKPNSLISGGDGSTITKDDGTTFTYQNSFGGFWYSDPANPYADNAQPNSWTPPLNQSWQWGVDHVNGVNIGGLFVLEPFIAPALFQAYPGVIDEWTLSQALSTLPSGNNLTSAMEDHYNTFITEEDIAAIAGAGLNWIRVPIPFWAISSWDNVGVDETGAAVSEPFAMSVCWKYVLRLLGWARKYGLRVNFDLHTAPGSQNGYNHSGKTGQVNFLHGPMGVANAQRMLDYIRVFAEFISQPEYENVVPVFGVINEALVKTIGQDQMSAFYLHVHDMLRGITGIGKGPYMSIHDGFIGVNTWGQFLPGNDRILMDTHPYFAFDGQPNGEPIDIPAVGDNTQMGGQWPQQACNSWSGSLNTSRETFGVTVAGEFSNGFNNCGLFVNGVGNGGSTAANCTFWSDSSLWDADTKAGVMSFALASMDALSDWFFWTWKIGESQDNIVEAPLWSYSLGLTNGWMPKDPRQAQGKCVQFGVSPTNTFDGNFPSYATGGAGAGTIAASASAQFGTWPPISISGVPSGQVPLLPTYTATASIITLSAPAPAGTASVSMNGWADSADTASMVTTVAGCAYPDAWSALSSPVPTVLCGAGGAVVPPPAGVTPPPATVTSLPATVTPPPAAVSPPSAVVSPPSAVVSPPSAAISPPPASISPPPAKARRG